MIQKRTLEKSPLCHKPFLVKMSIDSDFFRFTWYGTWWNDDPSIDLAALTDDDEEELNWFFLTVVVAWRNWVSSSLSEETSLRNRLALLIFLRLRLYLMCFLSFSTFGTGGKYGSGFATTLYLDSSGDRSSECWLWIGVSVRRKTKRSWKAKVKFFYFISIMFSFIIKTNQMNLQHFIINYLHKIWL